MRKPQEEKIICHWTFDIFQFPFGEDSFWSRSASVEGQLELKTDAAITNGN